MRQRTRITQYLNSNPFHTFTFRVVHVIPNGLRSMSFRTDYGPCHSERSEESNDAALTNVLRSLAALGMTH